MLRLARCAVNSAGWLQAASSCESFSTSMSTTTMTMTRSTLYRSCLVNSLLAPTPTATATTRWMSTEAKQMAVKPTKTKITEITTEAQFHVVLKKAIKSITDYVEKQETSNKKLQKTLRRWALLSNSRFRNDLPPEIVSFAFFLLSQLVQARVNTAELANELVETFNPVIELKMSDFDGGQLTRIFWGFGDLGYPPEPRLMDALCAHLLKILNSVSFADCVNVVVSFLKYEDLTPSGEMIAQISDQLLSKIDQATPRMLGRLLVTLTRLQHSPQPNFIDAVGLQAEKTMADASVEDIIELLHGIAPLDYQPVNVAKLVDAAVAQLESRGFSSVGPRLLGRLAGSLGLLSRPPTPKLAELFAQRIRETTGNVSHQVISDLFVACGLGKFSLEADVVASLLQQFRDKPYRVTCHYAGNLLSGLGRLGHAVEPDLSAWLLHRALLRVASAEVDEILVLLTGAEDASVALSQELLFELHGRTVELLGGEQGDELSPYFEIYRRLSKVHGYPCAELKQMLQALTERDPDDPDSVSADAPAEQIQDPDEIMQRQLDSVPESERERTPANTEDFFDGVEEFEYLDIQNSLGKDFQQSQQPEGEEEDDE